MKRKRAKVEGIQGIEEMTSEKSRGHMAHATARNGRNHSDTLACLTRPRGLEAARTMWMRGRREHVVREMLSDVNTWTTRPRDVCDLQNYKSHWQRSWAAFQPSSRPGTHRLEVGSGAESNHTFIIHTFHSLDVVFRERGSLLSLRF